MSVMVVGIVKTMGIACVDGGNDDNDLTLDVVE